MQCRQHEPRARPVMDTKRCGAVWIVEGKKQMEMFSRRTAKRTDNSNNCKNNGDDDQGPLSRVHPKQR